MDERRAKWEALRRRPLPAWFDEAKLGVFLHWGLYSVPGWAPRAPDIQTILRTRTPRWFFRNNPYAEWYANTVRLAGSPTQRHHAATYGAHFPYQGFGEEFDRASSAADLKGLAVLCREAGARYVVLTTKHHDGFCLWPTETPHPVMGRYHASRDLVGELSAAVRSEGLRMGLYYSGGYDWPYNGAVVEQAADAVLAAPHGRAYARYAEGHVRELIDRYRPDVLWNDISWPAESDLGALFEDYYEAVPDGVVNDRWFQPRLPRNPAVDAVVRTAGSALERLWPLLPERSKALRFPRPPHADFSTPEYAGHGPPTGRKWEATRGVGHSFGANRNEDPAHVVTASELVRSFVDIVAGNGNLLIGVGPLPDGSVPGWQQEPLLGLGRWLGERGEAVHGCRPWKAGGIQGHGAGVVRCTRCPDAGYALLPEAAGGTRVELTFRGVSSVNDVRLLGGPGPLDWSAGPGVLRIRLPDRLSPAPVQVLRLAPLPDDG